MEISMEKLEAVFENLDKMIDLYFNLDDTEEVLHLLHRINIEVYVLHSIGIMPDKKYVCAKWFERANLDHQYKI